MSSLIVSVSGIRGIVGEGLSVEAATAFAAALGAHIGGGTFVLCRDGRPSGDVLRHAVLAGLRASGCSVADIGVAPTPTCGFAVRHLQAAGGVQITASHNPAPWNGLKMFGPDGMVLTAAEGRKVQELFENGTRRWAAWDRLGSVTTITDADAWHRTRILELADTAAIRARRFRVLLDANGGAGGPAGVRLLQALGCETVGHACTADGRFLHEPEPIAENLRDVCPLVARERCAAGLVLDPDADRLALIDETGRYIGEELTLALAVHFRLQQERGPVVVNMSTSRVVEDICKRFDCPFARSAVGEANVAGMMRQLGAVIGGEGNGGVIDPRVGFVRDPFIGMAQILTLMAAEEKSLSELVRELPSYSIVKDKYHVDRERLPLLFASLPTRWPEAKVNKVDGLRLDWPDRWVHVRSSNTEPIVRVIAEAPAAETAAKLCREVGEFLCAS
jgi:phosphomannomutase